MAKPLISITTPVFNEEENVRACYEAILELRKKLAQDYDFEHVFTDNHSTDSTFEILAQIAARDPSVRVFRFSKNFGFQKSVFEGLMRARGDAAIQFDCDLQDPPEMMETFLTEWKKGYKVVYGIRKKRMENFFDVFLRKLFYWVLSRLSTEDIPRDAGDFRLVDRRILEELKKVHDNKIYLRGRIAEMGFRQKGVIYARRARTAGESKFNFTRNFSLAIDAILTHSTVPLRLSIYFGLSVFVLAILGSCFYLYSYFHAESRWPAGFTTLILFLLFQLGLTSLFLGVLGEYVARIYEHLRMPSGVILENIIDSTEEKS